MFKKNRLLGIIFIFFLVFGGYSSIFFYKTPASLKEKKDNDINNRISFHTIGDYSYLYPILKYPTGGEINSAAISADGRYIAAASADNNIYLFDTSNLANPLIWTYFASLHTYWGSVAISSDGNYIAAGSYNSTFLFDKSNGTPLWSYNFQLPTERVFDIEISSDGTHIAVITVIGTFPNLKGNVYLFNNSIVPLKTPMWNYTTDYVIYSVAISSDGYYTTIGTVNYTQFPYFEDGEIYLFNKSMSPNKTPMWKYQTGAIFEVDMNLNCSIIVAVDDFNNQIHVFEDQSSTPSIHYLETLHSIWTIDLSSNGQYIFVGCYDYIIHHVKGEGSYASDKFDAVWPVAISDNGRAIAVESELNYVHCFDTHLNHRWCFGTNDTIEIAKISNDGSYIVLGCSDSNIYLFNSSGYHHLPSYIPFSIIADSPDTDGNIGLAWNEPLRADNYSIFHYDKRIDQINSSLDLVEAGITEPYGFDDPYQISGLPKGTHYYRIVAYNEYGYTVSYCRSVTVSLPPGEFLLTSTANDPDPDGQFNLNWDTPVDVDNYSVYEHTNFITEINYTLDLIASGLVVNTLPRVGYNDGEYYFIVEAINEFGTTTSNCIKITVGQPSQGGDNLWEDLLKQGILIPLVGGIVGGIVGIAFFIIKRKLRKQAEKREKNE